MKYRFIDIINPRKWLAVLQSCLLRDNKGMTLHYAEQVVYACLVCAPCVEKGSCLHCSCAMPEAALAPSASCSKGRWEVKMNKEDWEMYKIIHNIKLKL